MDKSWTDHHLIGWLHYSLLATGKWQILNDILNMSRVEKEHIVTHFNHTHFHFICIFSLFKTVTPSSLLFSFHPSCIKFTGWRFSSACRNPLSRSQIYMEKSTHARRPALLFPKPLAYQIKGTRLVGQQGNMAHGTHIMVFHQSLKINTTQRNTHPSFQISPQTPARQRRGALKLLFAVEKKQDMRLL